MSGDYCAFAHLSAMLESYGDNSLMAMWEVYFDDSGTDGTCDIAIAACYVARRSDWDRFLEDWNIARRDEGFDYFHMAEFMAPRWQKQAPWCDWDDDKKNRVYRRLAKIINASKWIGVAAAVPKKEYDELPDEIKEHHGREHYAYAVRSCLNRIKEWREKSGIVVPMRYVFDFEQEGSPKRIEINKIFSDIHESWGTAYGMEVGGHTFESKKLFKPLQAADILAWQMRSHMRKIAPLGHDDEALSHWGFSLLRTDQTMDLGFYTADQLAAWVEEHKKFEAQHGRSIYEVYDEQKRVQKVRSSDERNS